jgi:hypothetical protein
MENKGYKSLDGMSSATAYYCIANVGYHYSGRQSD